MTPDSTTSHHRTLKKQKSRNAKGLKLAQESFKPGAAAASSSREPALLPSTRDDPNSSLPSSASSATNKLSDQLSNLEIGLEFKLDLKPEDLQVIDQLGSGNGGVVSKVEHIPTKRVMARKLIHFEAKQAVRKQILRELQIMHDCSSDYVVSFFGAFVQEKTISIVMEYMDKGSFDNVYRRNGPIPERILAKVSVAVVNGLSYLYEKHRIIHRDVKPSNILLSSSGYIKLCDFGVSGEAAYNSIVDTFVGTQIYMSPERLQGGKYSTRGDTWSLGITLVEIALGRFPFMTEDESGHDHDPRTESNDEREATLTPSTAHTRRASLIPSPRSPNGGLAPFEMIMLIVNEPSPRLPESKFSKLIVDFVSSCLEKEVSKRPTPRELLTSDYIVSAASLEVDVAAYCRSLM